ncbi:alcohol dehydrogenase family protein [Vibrio ulleungensis]|uniref:Alcohol dehydrogenase family protein n=1 Tax=Vibrio ulleungensis TaxID=2807619 RepID=A0ABS2HKT9_9VIBR|nr:alcohol dehydrogenase family protein [Vibrio ulleungensis]MBM7036818.1 alcohol dehydrogenase family protein [Vibrio ulleungensis]
MSIPQKMKGVQLVGHGGVEQLVINPSINTPHPADDEVLIKVLAAAVNNTDINTRIGWYSKSKGDSSDASWSGSALQFPRIQGADVCGMIVAVGKNVDASRIGDRVLVEPCITRFNGQDLAQPYYFGSECDGGFAQYTVVDSKHAYAVKSSLTDVELASFPCSYSTAENMLTRANVCATDTVLISGASGGVGSAAVQLAKARGAKIIAICGSEKKDQLLGYGADEVIARGANLVDSLGENSVDVVIDLVAGKQWPEFLQLLKPKGRYAVAGAIGGAHVELDVRSLYLKDLSFFGCTVLEPQVFENLVTHIEQQNIRPMVSQWYLLDDIAGAQQRFLEKGHVGKIVLVIP